MILPWQRLEKVNITPQSILLLTPATQINASVSSLKTLVDTAGPNITNKCRRLRELLIKVCKVVKYLIMKYLIIKYI